MPKDEGEIIVLLSLFAQFQQGAFPGVGIHQVYYKTVYFAVLVHARIIVRTIAVGIRCGELVMALGGCAARQRGASQKSWTALVHKPQTVRFLAGDKKPVWGTGDPPSGKVDEEDIRRTQTAHDN